MTAIDWIQIAAFALGLIVSAIIILIPHFGRCSWLLSLFLISSSLGAGALTLPSMAQDWHLDASIRLAFILLLLAAPIGALASSTIAREDSLAILKRRGLSAVLIILGSLISALMLYSVSARTDLELPPETFPLGPGAYLGALYLIIVSVVALANLEQTLRQAHEHVRWEIKFLILGMAAIFASIIYICSNVLLYSPWLGIVSLSSLRLFSVIFLLSNLLILVSWKRGSGRARVVVSQKVIYSSITLFSVGLYLIISSLVARWASQLSQIGLPMEALVFLLSVLLLSVILLWTTFRHRAVWLIRRHLLAGSYDYRQYWIEASEKIRSLDPPEVAAEALVGIVQNALGALEISVWSRQWNPNRLKLLASRGSSAGILSPELPGVVEKFIDIVDPVSVEDIGNSSMDDLLSSFAAQTKATVIAPLQSGGRMVGILAVGHNQSGRPYGWEAKEFLGVLAKHAAGELQKADMRNAMLQAKEAEAFGAFSTFLLHDLKNFASTLSLIAGNASKHRDNPEFQRDAFQSIFQIAEKMKRLCNNLRMFSSASAGAKKIDDLNHLIQNVADNLNVEMGGRLGLDLGELPKVVMDAGEIARLLKNLLLNARAAISDSGSIRLATRCRDNIVEVAVEDNGCGMKAEFLQRELFLPFHTTKSDGLGIGLFHSKKIVEAHNGTIQVESEEGKGTIVRILLPVSPDVPNVIG